MIAVAAIVLGTLASIGLLHVYWAVGGSLGKHAAIPSRDGRPVITPTPVGTACVAIALCVAGLMVAATAGLFPAPIPSILMRSGTAILGLVFVIRAIGDFRYVGLFKRVRDSRFARLDTTFYSPLCLILAALIGAVAIWS